MYQILPAVSEFDLCKINNAVSLTKTQFHICNLMQNVEDLFASAALYNPDIIFIDLQLEGIQDTNILYCLREQNPHAELIVMSSHCDFPEARIALKCQVDDYLCKPVSEQELCSCLLRIQQKLNLKMDQDFSLESAKFIGKLFIEFARKTPREKLMSEDTTNNLYQTHFVPGAYRLVNVCIESTDKLSYNNKIATEQCIAKLFRILKTECYELLFNHTPLRINTLLNYERSSDENIREKLSQCQKEVAELLPAGMICTFCCSGIHSRLSEISEMVTEAADTMWSRFHYGNNTVLYPTTNSPCPVRIQHIYENTEQQLKTACATLNLKLFQQTLASFFSHSDYIVGRYETRALFRRIEYYILDIYRTLIFSFADADKVSLNIRKAMYTANTLKEYKMQFADQLTFLFQQILSHHGEQSQPIRKAQHYIQEHYAAPVHLPEVAKYAGLTSPYLSARFKEELGIGFSDYLNRVRIDASKKLLLETDEKVITIAGMVGYTSQRYYSRVFKELEGIRPTEYRISNQRNRELPKNK